MRNVHVQIHYLNFVNVAPKENVIVNTAPAAKQPTQKRMMIK